MMEDAGTVGLGVDIVEIARMKRILERSPSFRERVFSEEERAYCDATAYPEAHYATRFAAREAVVKALGTGFFQEGVSWREIQVKRSSKGRPYVVLSGAAKRVAERLGVRELPISLSYTHTEAVACAMAITDDSLNASARRKDPMEELARQFKEVRGMLDEMDPSTDDRAVRPFQDGEAAEEQMAPIPDGEAAKEQMAPPCDGEAAELQMFLHDGEPADSQALPLQADE